MSNVSIFEKKWIDLVFEGKNKEYGAYQLRNNNSKTTLTAFLFGLVFIASISGLGLALSSFGSSPEPMDNGNTITDTIVIAHFDNPHREEPKSNDVFPQKKNTVDRKIVENPKYVAVDQADANQEVPTNDSLPTNNNTPSGDTSSTGTGSSTSGGNNSGGGTGTIPTVDEGPVKTFELDRQPSYPGGIKNFYEYIRYNFEKQDIEEETLKVMVSFVIEKNGTMTNITVLKNTNPAIDNEAIRVLKSLKTKWTPGYKDNQPVRTLFTLPITITL